MFSFLTHAIVGLYVSCFPLFPTGHGRLAVIIMYQGVVDLLCPATACVFISFLPEKGLDDNLVVHLKSKAGNLCFGETEGQNRTG